MNTHTILANVTLFAISTIVILFCFMQNQVGMLDQDMFELFSVLYWTITSTMGVLVLLDGFYSMIFVEGTQ